MKITNRFMSLSLAAAALMAVSSCKNSDISFPDYEYTSVYFSNQTPIRTIELGEDFEVDNTLDNQHKFQIGVACGGSYSGANVTVDFVVDESLCNNLYLDDAFTIPVKPMPKEYYDLGGASQIKVNKDFKGGIEVSLKPAFFEDPITCAKIDVGQVPSKMMQMPLGCYVIPLVMTKQTGVDKIITGEYNKEDHPNGAPSRLDKSSWEVAPKDYMLFAVNFISKYSGMWLRSGHDVINGVKNDRTVDNKYDIQDEKVYLTTNGLKTVSMPVSYIFDPEQEAETLQVVLTFDSADATTTNCTVSAPAGAAYTVSGSGKYIAHGATKYWGDKDRDLITLEYTINSGSNVYKTTDQLVMQRRCLVFNTFSYFIKSDK